MFDAYRVIGEVGKGAFGTVFKAKKNDAYFAIKIPHEQIQDEGENAPPPTTEIAILTKLCPHPHIIQLIEVIRGHFLVFEYAGLNLDGMIAFKKSREESFAPIVLQSIMWQILMGVKHMHDNHVMHRDLKPANILVIDKGPRRGKVVLADLGTAAEFPLAADDMHQTVVTLWYRAPELLLQKPYTEAIDCWSVGCIIAELLAAADQRFRALFPGPETPRQSEFQYEQLKLVEKMSTPARLLKTMAIVAPHAPCTALATMSRLLIMDPAKRATASNELTCPYFDYSSADCFCGSKEAEYPIEPPKMMVSKKQRV